MTDIKILHKSCKIADVPGQQTWLAMLEAAAIPPSYGKELKKCNHRGCTEPRYTSAAGGRSAYCKEHETCKQAEYNRRNAAKRREKRQAEKRAQNED